MDMKEIKRTIKDDMISQARRAAQDHIYCMTMNPFLIKRLRELELLKRSSEIEMVSGDDKVKVYQECHLIKQALEVIS